ncbi:MAG: TonB-dependent receptor, partial [Bacteroidales bacterium]|nr:TonB-dependent receptor [Bacteroidales bacterium]
TSGAITDLDGKFVLNATPENVLIVSFIGYETMEVLVGAQKYIEVKMMSTTTQLEEVMVVAYGTTKKQSFTGSASVVKADNIERMSVVSVDQAMQGTVSGIQVSGASGQPGSTSKIRIRGIGSISANQEPLFVIDGVPMQQGDFNGFSTSSSSLLATLNPNDIASMTVLKDAAAASLYGSRAANGVVIITTKRGKEGKTKFKFKTEHGFSDFAYNNIEIVDGDTERAIKKEGLVNYWLDQSTEADPISLEQANAYALASPASVIPSLDDLAPKLDKYSDWQDELFRVGRNESYELSASGGDEKTTFFTSLSYSSQEGVMKGSDFERINGRVNLDHKANERLKLGMNLSISNSVQNMVPDNGSYYANPFYATRYFLTPTTPTHNEDGSFSEILGGQYPNLVKDLGLNTLRNNTFRSLSNAYVQYDIMEGLRFKSTFGLDAVFMSLDRYWSPLSNDGEVHNGYGEKDHRILNTITSSNIMTYDKSFGSHNFNLLGGYEIESFSNEYTMASANNYPNSILNTIENASKPLDTYNNIEDSRMLSYLSRLNYDYAGKYYFSASYRSDGSSTLAPDSRWANFYSVSGSWRISEEDFLKNALWLDDWKIKTSYGTNGTLPSDKYGHYRLYEFGQNYNSNPGSQLASLPSPTLTWEKNKTFNIGTEVSFMDRFTVELEWYNRYTTDLLLEVPISQVVGLDKGEVWMNVGEMRNSGWEFNFTSNNIRTTDFEWTTNLNLSDYNNEIVKLYDGQDISTFPFIYREGESFNSLYLREWAGVDSQTGAPMWYKNTTNDNGEIISGRETTTNSSEAEKVIVGVTDPDLVGGVSNTIRYKGFDASLLFTFRIGGNSYDATSYSTQSDGALPYAPIRETEVDRWQKPGDVTDVPRYVFGNQSESNYNSSRRMHKADYIRLKSINLGYTLPANLVKKAHFSSARVYMSAMNLWTWAAYDGYDPETTITGEYTWNMPPMKSVNFGIELNL